MLRFACDQVNQIKRKTLSAETPEPTIFGGARIRYRWQRLGPDRARFGGRIANLCRLTQCISTRLGLDLDSVKSEGVSGFDTATERVGSAVPRWGTARPDCWTPQGGKQGMRRTPIAGKSGRACLAGAAVSPAVAGGRGPI